MAQKVVTSLIDDLTGDPADETITFGLGGKSYEIDLSERNAKELRAALARFVEVARRSGGKVATSASARAAGDRERNQAIREWARNQGLEVGEKGRIPAAVIEQYDRRTVSGSPALVSV